jgi:hypothetical protein
MRLAEHDQHIAFRLAREDADRLRCVAERQGLSLSELLRQAVAVLIASEAPQQVPERSENPFVRAAHERRKGAAA